MKLCLFWRILAKGISHLLFFEKSIDVLIQFFPLTSYEIKRIDESYYILDIVDGLDVFIRFSLHS